MPERGALFRRGGAPIPDEPAALEAAGLCGSPNRRRPGSALDVSTDKPAKFVYCHQAKLAGKRRCKRHGGDAPIGPATSGWGKAAAAKGEARDKPARSGAGRYSKILGGDYAAAYEQSIAGGNGLTDLSEQIALCDARELKLVQTIEERRTSRGESGSLWIRARKCYFDARRAGRQGDPVAFNKLLEELGDAIKAGAGEEDAWRELRENMLVRRRLVQTQRQLVGLNGAYMSRPELAAIAAQLIDMFRELLPERERLDVATKRVDEILTNAAAVPTDLGGVN